MNELATLEFGLQQLARQGAAERRELRYYSELHTDWRNIFQLWRDNGEQVPFVVVKSTWSAASGHFLIVEEVKVKRWPYGDAWGSYHWNGSHDGGPREKISAAGTYNWRGLAVRVAGTSTVSMSVRTTAARWTASAPAARGKPVAQVRGRCHPSIGRRVTSGWLADFGAVRLSSRGIERLMAKVSRSAAFWLSIAAVSFVLLVVLRHILLPFVIGRLPHIC